MHRKYELLILDYGGVYSFDYDPSSFNKIMLSVFGKQPNKTEKEEITQLSRQLGSNNITTDTYVNKVAQLLAVPTPERALFEQATISHGFPPTPVMVDLVKDARAAGLKVSLLSDMYLFELSKTRPEGRYEGFDHTSFSSEIGCTKASPEPYIATLDYFGVKPGKALFVDDVPQYAQNARDMGMDVLWADKSKFSSPEQLAEAISDLLGL